MLTRRRHTVSGQILQLVKNNKHEVAGGGATPGGRGHAGARVEMEGHADTLTVTRLPAPRVDAGRRAAGGRGEEDGGEWVGWGRHAAGGGAVAG